MQAQAETAASGASAAVVTRLGNALAFIERLPPSRVPRLVLWSVCALFGFTLIWSLIAKLDIVAVAEGRLVPATYTKIVQPAESGIVREILVKDGDAVSAGQVLVRLDPTLAGADSKSLAGEIGLRRLTLRRIDAELAGQTLALGNAEEPSLFLQVQAQGSARRQAYLDALAQESAQRDRLAAELRAATETLNKLRATAPLVQQQADAYDKLVKDGFFSPLAVQDKRREAINLQQDLKSQEGAVASLNAQRAGQDKKTANLTSQYRSQLQNERVETQAQLAKLEQEAAKQSYREAMLELKAPQAGIVKDLATTTVGAVVAPGTVLLTIVPKDEPLIAEVRIHHDDIGFVEPGQPVKLKLAAYPFQKYGMVEGTVQTIAADVSPVTMQDAKSNTPADLGFKALIALNTQQLTARGQPFVLHPGMQVVAEIRQGERTVMEYLLSPVTATVMQAGRER
jgi:HlyD family secretion protein